VEPAAHLEPYPGRANTVAHDLAYLHTRGISDVFVYEPTVVPAADWASLRQRISGMRLFAQTGKVGWAAAARFDGVYTYDILAFDGSRACARRHERVACSAPRPSGQATTPAAPGRIGG
jgi:hypothetical protein